MIPPKFCHLHLHTEYSMLDGLGAPNSYAKKAAELGFKYLAITDHGNIDGLIEFQKSCNKHGIKPILGCEAYIVSDALEKRDKKRGHILLLVKNKKGFKNLCSLLTYANIEGFYYKPRIDYKQLLSHCEGLVISTACAGSFLTKLDDGISFFYDLFDEMKDDLYLEVMPHKIQEQKEINKLAMNLSKKTGCKIIATNDCHYIEKKHWKAQEVLLAIQTKALWTDPKRWRFSIKNLHLRTAKEMLEALKKVGMGKRQYLSNTIEIAEKCCCFQISKQEVLLPRIKNLPLKVKEPEFLMKLCIKGFHRIYGGYIGNNRIYNARLQEEFNLIVDKKFERVFLIVWELVGWCKNNKILVGAGRGSVAGSLVAFLLGITTVDPIKHNLLFSRFINKNRIDLPDIDIDFEDRKRYIVKQHLEAVYGEGHIANISSFNRMKAKGVIRDVSRVFNIPLNEVDSFAKLIEDNDEHTGIQEAIDYHEEAKEFANNHPKIVEVAKILEGQVKNYSAHAAALIVSREPLVDSDRCNLIRRKVKNETTTLINWEKNNAEYVGLMKLDALGLKLLSVFSETIKLIKENYDLNINIDKIDIEDKKVLKEINDGNTIGLFQLNTYAMTSLIKEMGIDQFKDLSDAMALVRPGPYASGMAEEYVKRKHGKRWDEQHIRYTKITKDTYGVIVYQEQVMEVINKMAGLPYSTADKIRKIIGKKRDKKEFAPYKRKFIKGCLKEKTFDKQEAEDFWTGLQEHAKYSFGKAHSTSYAILGVQSGWLKKYYPTEFICASLTFGSKTKKPLLIEEAYRLGLTLVLPKVGISDAIEWVARDHKLYIPFQEIKGVGPAKAKQATVMIPQNNIGDLFYTKKSNTVRKHKGSFGILLESIGAYKQHDNVQTSEEIQSYFDFRIVTDPYNCYKNLYNFFKRKIRLDRIDKILNGDLKEIKKLNKIRPIVRKVTFKGHNNLMSCNDILRKECKAPVCPSPGKNNIVILGEAPGYEENEKGEGFIGNSGKLIWTTLDAYGYKKSDFHITNACKCFPSLSKTPNAKHIKACNKFLKKELKEIKPKIILAFGNTSLNLFTGRSSGITNMSGKILWNEEYSSWIIFCLHPAATLHDPSRKPIFKQGIKSFLSMLKIAFKK